jgi:predicted acylesterase/phospholipase RssA
VQSSLLLAQIAAKGIEMEHDGTDVKVGLALSGGGFRASFFHLGVLARLAELDLLRRVEVLSTVSGGSIVGALYYLRVKNLLETKPDRDIEPEDYVLLVKELESEFCAATDRNVRSRTFANLFANFRMAFPSYSRSDRIGDLYDRLFYKPAWKDVDDPELRQERKLSKRRGIEEQIPMRRLKIRPAGDPNRVDFSPRDHNLTRVAKVPVLVLNATSLNHGRAWRFEASRMGEPAPLDPEVRDVLEDLDKNGRYAQGDYGQLTEKQADFPLGLAVAASACVPMLFHPLAISNLFDGARVQLVDGGVHDNQGVQTLLDTQCTHLLLSDASGQMDDLSNPITRVPAVAGRSISIYGDSLRDEQLVRAQEQPRAAALMHLRKGLSATLVHPFGTDGRPLAAEKEERVGPVQCEDFGVDTKVQERLSRVRTDLDSFTQVEAWSLGLDAYRMTSDEVSRTPAVAALAGAAAPNEKYWAFGAVAPEIDDPSPAFLRHLDAAGERFFKPAALMPGLRHLPKLLAAALVAALLVWQWDEITSGTVPVWGVLVALVFVAGYLFTGTTPVLRQASGFLPSFVGPIVLAIPLWLLSWVVLLLVNPLFLALGKAARVVRAPTEVRPPEAPRLPTQV